MLLELRVGHLALVEEITISLSPGLTVLTGETGAGKSLIAGALILLSGGKADKGLVRQGEDEAFVEGVFDLGGEPAIRRELKKTGIHLAHDNILVLRRELRLQGRSRILINGLISSLALLERIGSLLLTVQSQDQQRELSDPDFARAFLDAQLGNEELLGAMRHCWEDFHNCQEALAERMQEEELAKEQLDLWRYQHEELVRASLRLGEEEELNEALALKRHASSLKEGAARTAHLLSEDDDPVREKLGRSIAALQPLAGKSRQLEGILRSLQEAESIVSDAASELSRFLDDRDLDPVGLDELEFRKTLYEELHRKYRRNTLELQQLQELLAERIARQESAASDLHALTLELSAARARMSEVAESLNSRRTAGAEATATAARAKIQQLALPSLELEFRVSLLENHAGDVEVSGRTCQVTPQGCDRVELWIRTNPGERMGPVDSIASGGERSRIHLGLTAMRQQAATTPLLLLDEIDAGLGMDAAPPVASLLQQLADASQVICITHLPTMAVYGAQHLMVAKRFSGERTVLDITSLKEKERVTEVARLLGGEGWGSSDGESQRAYAKELLKTGRLARKARHA